MKRDVLHCSIVVTGLAIAVALFNLYYGESRYSTDSDANDGGWTTKPSDRVAVSGECTVKRVDARQLTQQDFEMNFAFTEPVVIFNLDNAVFRAKTAKQPMLKQWASQPVVLNSADTYSQQRVPTTFGEYIERILRPQNADSLGNETLYLFGDIDRSLWDPLLKHYSMPRWKLPKHGPALSFGIAGAGTGVPFHFHGPVYAEVIYGAKQWFLCPYEKVPDFDPDTTTLKWYLNNYSLLDPSKRPMACLLKPGEAIYVPDKWWHATLNTETSVFMSTFLSP